MTKALWATCGRMQPRPVMKNDRADAALHQIGLIILPPIPTPVPNECHARRQRNIVTTILEGAGNKAAACFLELEKYRCDVVENLPISSCCSSFETRKSCDRCGECRDQANINSLRPGPPIQRRSLPECILD